MFIKQLQQANTPAAQAAIVNAACTKARKQINTINCAHTLHPSAHVLNSVIKHANKRMQALSNTPPVAS